MAEQVVTDPIADREWRGFLAASPSATIFHHPLWLGLLRRRYGYPIHARVERGGGGAIAAGIPVARIESRLTGRRLVALPFSDLCPVALAGGADPAALDAVADGLAAEQRRSGLELSVHAPLPRLPGAELVPGFIHHLIPVRDGPAEPERRFSRSAARNLRRAEREGLRVQRRRDAAGLAAFYRLHLKTRRRLGVPTQPRAFVAGFERLFEAGLGFVALVVDGAAVIAAAVFFRHGGTLTYKYGASESRALGKRPNNLLFAEALRWAEAEGCHTLDLGRTEIANPGLRAFKRSLGALEVDLPYTRLGAGPATRHALRDRLVGATIRRSPKAVGRLAGEALYGHFG